MKKLISFSTLAFLLFLICSCEKNSQTIKNRKDCDTTGISINEACCSTTGPVQIYKTRNDYSNNVSVMLSDDKSRITAYPGITDAKNQRPVQLANGYYLKRMVGNAFLSISIDDYINLTKQPTPDELYTLVLDDTPFTEFYECCRLCLFDIEEINELIQEDKLCNCDSVGWWIF